MSEPNSPLNRPTEPGLESSLDWWNPFPELIPDRTETDPTSGEIGDEQAIDAGINQSSSAFQAAANPDTAPVVAHIKVSRSSDRCDLASQEPIASSAAEPETADAVTTATEPPNLIDLISLIQELNQCNGVLLDRVSQLEDALERSQQALQGQDQPSESFALQQTEDPAAAQTQIANLFSQLEFAHQTIQRQHILVETLTAELESSQERVAQLEREAALQQQRYSEQTQVLVQSEGTCRDLQARLQRQQRYTLQFKAALEKCLEMPIPPSEPGGETIAPPIDSLLLPKAQQIQPWSRSTAPQETLLPWMKRFKAAEEAALEEQPAFNPEDANQQEDLTAEIAVAAEAIVEPVRSSLSAVQLPVLAPLNAAAREDQPDAQQTSESPLSELIEITPVAEPALPDPAASISYSLKPRTGMAPPPELVKQIDAVVQPLADRLAEALLSQATAAEPTEPESIQVSSVQSALVQDIVQDTVQATVQDIAQVSPIESIVQSDADAEVVIADPDSLLASAMSEAEDALWQDLARLIEVSPEEAIKASLTGDLAAFESLNFEAVPAIETAKSTEPAALPRVELPQNAVSAKTESPFTSDSIAPAQPGQMQDPGVKPGAAKLPALEHQNHLTAPAIPALATHPNSPSPLLHPSRATKPKRSLSSVELPSFLRQEDSKPLPT